MHKPSLQNQATKTQGDCIFGVGRPTYVILCKEEYYNVYVEARPLNSFVKSGRLVREQISSYNHIPHYLT